MGKGVPDAPDYKGAAQQQAASSQQNTQAQTVANRPNQNTPFASSQWVQGPDGQWHQQTSFSGPMQGIVNSLQGQAAQAVNAPLDNGTAARDQAINATYNQMASRLNPQFQQQQSQLATQLANQGLAPGSAAYRQAQAQFARGKNDAFQGAMNNAVQQGLAAQNLTFNQNLAARRLPLQELAGMRGYLSMPSFATAGKADALQALAAAMAQGNFSLQQSDMQNKILGDTFSSLGGLIGDLGNGPLSDERAKTDVKRLGVEAIPGVPLATFAYKADPRHSRYVGVIAQDLEKVAPDKVQKGADGLKHVAPEFAPFRF